jgi:YegS/Rv2252/BmrU family lipid kinase
VLVAVGGDGTINEVASALVGQTASLGIIPAGSGNGLARNIDVSLDQEEALKQLLSGSDHLHDIGKWDDKCFFNLMGIGLEAAVSKRFRDRVNRGFMGYAIDILNEYRNLKPYQFRIQTEEARMHFEAVQITVCLGPQYGNEAYIAPLKLFNNGAFQLVVLKEVKLHRIPFILPALFNQSFHELPEVETYNCKELLIESDAPFLHLDAEVYPTKEKMNVKISPKILNVRY